MVKLEGLPTAVAYQIDHRKRYAATLEQSEICSSKFIRLDWTLERISESLLSKPFGKDKMKSFGGGENGKSADRRYTPL